MNTNKKTLKVIMDETNRTYMELNKIIDNNAFLSELFEKAVEILEIEFKHDWNNLKLTRTYNAAYNNRLYQFQEIEDLKNKVYDKLLILDITDAL